MLSLQGQRSKHWHIGLLVCIRSGSNMLVEFYVVFDFIGQNIMMMEGLPDTVVPSNRLYNI